MGESGADLKLSAKARKLFPFKVECKNHEAWTNVYKAFDQAEGHKEEGIPLLVIKKNRKKPLIVIDAGNFFNIMEKVDWTKISK